MQTTMLNSSEGGGDVAARKRKADESSLSSDSDRFTKRFNLLNLGKRRDVNVLKQYAGVCIHISCD